jgi:hypothetical protein
MIKAMHTNRTLTALQASRFANMIADMVDMGVRRDNIAPKGEAHHNICPFTTKNSHEARIILTLLQRGSTPRTSCTPHMP